MDIIKKQNLEGNIWKILLFHALANLSFAAPIMVLFWQENGLTLKEAMVLQSIFSFCIVVLEIPTGYFADVFGRKKSLIYSAFFMVFGYLFYSLGHDFYQFLIAEITIAFAISFLSGADSAMVYDTLKDVQKEKDFKKIWGNILFYSLIAAVFASIVGGFIAKINFRWTLYLEFLLIIPAIPLAFTLMEPKRHMIIFKKGYLLELFKVIKSSVLKNEKIKWLIIYSGFIVGFNWAALWLYQPYFKLSGIDIAYFGIVFAAFNAVAAISSKYSHRIEKYFGQKRSLTLLMFLLGASYLLMSNFIFLFSFSFAFLQQFVRGFSRPLIEDYLHKLTNSEIRATVLSIHNMAGKLLYALIIPFIGWIADAYSLTQALTIMGITVFAVGSVLLFILYKNKIV